jgi:hypothetical protein
MNAILHGNDGVLEPLFIRGVPLTLVLDNGQTALYNAVIANNAKIVEFLIIESMRTFQLFPVEDVIRCFEWIFEKRHYHLVDLMLFAVNQHPKSQKAFEKTINAINFMDKLVELYKKNEIQPYHLTEFSTSLCAIAFDKHIYFYLYYRWEKDIGDRYANSIECYRVLADLYLQKDILQRKKNLSQLRRENFVSYAFSFILLNGSYFFIHRQVPIVDLLLPIVAGLMFLAWSIAQTIQYNTKYQSNILEVNDRIFVKACRDGDYAKVREMIRNKVHVNCLCGVGETTALFEAILFKHESISNLLQQFHAYSGKRSVTLLYP